MCFDVRHFGAGTKCYISGGWEYSVPHCIFVGSLPGGASWPGHSKASGRSQERNCQSWTSPERYDKAQGQWEDVVESGTHLGRDEERQHQWHEDPLHHEHNTAGDLEVTHKLCNASPVFRSSDAQFLLLTRKENSGQIVRYSDHHSNNRPK